MVDKMSHPAATLNPWERTRTRASTPAASSSRWSPLRLRSASCAATPERRVFAYNWAVTEVSSNLSVRRAQREAGVGESDLTPPLSWSAYGLSKLWNESKAETAPWWQEVSMHAFRSGLTAAADALGNFSDSKKGERKGRRVGFPRRKSRRRSTPSVSFVEINHHLSWLDPDRHHVRLMLPQSTPDPGVRRRRSHLGWIHTVESTRRLYRLVESGRASIQKVTISYRGGRWQAAFSVRHLVAPAVAASAEECRQPDGRPRRWPEAPGHPVEPGARTDRSHRTCGQPGCPLAALTPPQEARPRHCPLPAWVEKPDPAPQAARPSPRHHRQDQGPRTPSHHQRVGAALRGHRDRGSERGGDGQPQGTSGPFRR